MVMIRKDEEWKDLLLSTTKWWWLAELKTKKSYFEAPLKGDDQ